MKNRVLDVKVKCKGNDQCIFNGEDRFLINIIITNNHKSAIGFPLDFYESKGPIIRLIDMRTKKETYVPNSPGVSELFDKFTMIQPGKSLIVEEAIYSDDLRQFGGPYVDVSAELTVTSRILVDGKHVDYEGSDTIRIVSKNKP